MRSRNLDPGVIESLVACCRRSDLTCPPSQVSRSNRDSVRSCGGSCSCALGLEPFDPARATRAHYADEWVMPSSLAPQALRRAVLREARRSLEASGEVEVPRECRRLP